MSPTRSGSRQPSAQPVPLVAQNRLESRQRGG
jgi:hypothetical protein